MSAIEYFRGCPFRAVSDCGRVVVRTDAHGEVDGLALLDGGQVFRGYHAVDGRMTSQAVADDDWALVSATFAALRTAIAAYREVRDAAYYASLDRRADRFLGAECVRGGAYDPYADGGNR